jgi:hypothetical protein
MLIQEFKIGRLLYWNRDHLHPQPKRRRQSGKCLSDPSTNLEGPPRDRDVKFREECEIPKMWNPSVQVYWRFWPAMIKSRTNAKHMTQILLYVTQIGLYRCNSISTTVFHYFRQRPHWNHRNGRKECDHISYARSICCLLTRAQTNMDRAIDFT